LLIFHYGLPDLTPSLTGSYQVSHFVVNKQEKQPSVCTDSLLTRVYMDLGNDCVFEFNGQQRRLFGNYRLSDENRKITIVWYYPKNAHDTLTGEIRKEAIGNAVSINGKMGQDSIQISLVKRK
jgi:hypothetical protein